MCRIFTVCFPFQSDTGPAQLWQKASKQVPVPEVPSSDPFASSANHLWPGVYKHRLFYRWIKWHGFTHSLSLHMGSAYVSMQQVLQSINAWIYFQLTQLWKLSIISCVVVASNTVRINDILYRFILSQRSRRRMRSLNNSISARYGVARWKSSEQCQVFQHDPQIACLKHLTTQFDHFLLSFGSSFHCKPMNSSSCITRSTLVSMTRYCTAIN